MKIRIISGIIGIIILIALLFSPKIIFEVGIFILTLGGINEFLNVTNVKSIIFKIIGCLGAIPFIFAYQYEDIIYYSIFILILFSFIAVILDYGNKNASDAYLTIFGTIFTAFLFSHILKVHNMQKGEYFIWFVFLSAWSTDTFAYFVGLAFGKHKLTQISPKKTIEGAIGGLIGCLIICSAYGYFINNTYNINIGFINYIIMALFAGIIGQFGDLAASLIKRSMNVKDYGNIMPGHGGILDRFDSVLFIAPAIYYYLHFYLMLQ